MDFNYKNLDKNYFISKIQEITKFSIDDIPNSYEYYLLNINNSIQKGYT